jgi:hypothetical protein
VGLLYSQWALAFEFTFGEEDVSWETQLTYSLADRLGAQNCSMIGDPTSFCGARANVAQWSNADNGDLNYKQGQLFASTLKATSEVLVTFPEDYKFFVRATGLFDMVATDTQRTELSPSGQEQLAHNAWLLDLWVSKDFTINGREAHVRVGNQVINWGESIFAVGGINGNIAYNYQKLLVPGTQFKEAVLPVPMISFATGLGGGFSTEMYYQPFGWRRTVVAPVGGYWSDDNVYGLGVQPLVLSTLNFNLGGPDARAVSGQWKYDVLQHVDQQLEQFVYAGPPYYTFGIPIAPDKRPSGSGQYGFYLHYKPSETPMDMGLYFLNYDDTTPVLTSLASGPLQNSFQKHRLLVGASTNFGLGDWSMGAELSYRPKDAIALSSCYGPGGPLDANTNLVSGVDCPLFADKQKWQTDLTAQLNMSPSQYPVLSYIGASEGYLTGELTWINYPGVGPDTPIYRTIDGVQVMQVPDAIYGIWLNNNSGLGYPIFHGAGTANSVGMVVDYNWTYDGTLVSGWAVTPGTTFSWALYGDTPTYFANYLQGAKSENFYVLFNENPSDWQAGVNVTIYWGGNTAYNGKSLRQPFADRDFIGAFVTRNL